MVYLIAFVAVTLTTGANLMLIWFLDRFEKEPIWLLSVVFIWGAVPSIIISLVFEMIFGIPLGMMFDAVTADIFMGSIVAPVVEESSKAVALLLVFLVLRHELDDVLDGIVFGAVIGAGFAWVEDLFYLYGALAEGGVQAMGFVFVLRIFVFGLNHAFFTALTGLGFGIAKVVRSCWLGGLAVIFFFTAGIGAHFLHNTLVGVGGDSGVLVSFVIHWGGALGLFLIIVVAWFTEWQWIKSELREEVQLGHVGERDYHQAVKWFGRVGWELKFLAALDFAGYFRIRKMFNLLVKLSFLKRSQRRRPRESTERHIEETRARVARLRAKFA